MKKGSIPCGLYIRIDTASEMDVNLTLMRQAAFVINRSEYEKNMHVIEITDNEGKEEAAALVQLAKMEGMVAIVRGDYIRAAELDADGVLLEDAAKFEEARRGLGEDKIIGVICGIDKARAEHAMALKADYVAFGLHGHALPPVYLFEWWAVRTQIPALALGPVTNDDVGSFVRAGAGFLDATDYIKTQEKGVMQGTVNMLYAIDLAAESVAIN